ncbi:hypothetical protein GKZ90_0012820 [Flavobacterium sp. MC2016-06]|uniref:hypothetical protein n=1 Tax=Flavobacterium sp. MC2016-06 TaxID=2676308 RepID=UPI0012BAE1BF|nr:hypothetical protein [Flavobacterium sp. MC2016-06]MBU3860194.1 hypothetical protein [Flavobacterium sp. MC2016-06]
MDNQDKIFDKFKDAAHNAESKDFLGMEKVWSRVEEKLDKKEDKKTIALWKKIAIAASLLLVISLGSQFIKTDKNINTETTNKVVITETAKEAIQESESQKDKVAVSQDSGIISKTEADKILNNPINLKPTVAANEIRVEANTMNAEPPTPVYYERAAPSVASMSSGYLNMSDTISTGKDKAFTDAELSKSLKKDSYRIADAETETQKDKKNAPLIIMNGKALTHSDDAKRDKMMQKEIPNLDPENVESLVVLDQPLYIIDGNYYSEEDLFGKNPKSPYAPLNKQEIKTITILQDTEATEKYGEKGKKGVVIITTKAGKPASQK